MQKWSSEQSHGQLQRTQRRSGCGKGCKARLRKAWSGLALARAPGSRNLSGVSRPVLHARRRSQRSPRPRLPPRTCFGGILKWPRVEDQGERAGAAPDSWAEQELYEEHYVPPGRHGGPMARPVAERFRPLSFGEPVTLSSPPTGPHALPFRV